MSETVLIVDDEDAIRRLVRVIFPREGFTLREAATGEAALEAATAHSPDVVLLDLTLPDLDGLTVLERLKASLPFTPVVILTGSLDVKQAVRATRLGAFDYLTKPIDSSELVAVMRRAFETKQLRVEVQELRRELRSTAADALVVQMGPSAHVKRIVDEVNRVAASTLSVLILGETGTGKELVAQAVHQASDRKRRPFVALDCGAIPELLLESELFGHERGAFTGAERRREGHFRLAEGGTCFLDEVGNLPLRLQAKLLRTIESKQVQAVGADRTQLMDVRFLAATNDDLQERVKQGLFRADLYFRLAQFTIALPPLRDRPEDLSYLTQRFTDEAAVELRRPVQYIDDEALERLRQHDWPGNVRELRNVVRQAVLHAEGFTIRVQDIRAPLSASAHEPTTAVEAPPSSLREAASRAAAAAERQAIAQALRATGGNKSQAARALQTDYKTLHVKMKTLGIRAHEDG
jgi:DNA-binding NtrC family response regulator